MRLHIFRRNMTRRDVEIEVEEAEVTLRGFGRRASEWPSSEPQYFGKVALEEGVREGALHPSRSKSDGPPSRKAYAKAHLKHELCSSQAPHFGHSQPGGLSSGEPAAGTSSSLRAVLSWRSRLRPRTPRGMEARSEDLETFPICSTDDRWWTH